VRNNSLSTPTTSDDGRSGKDCAIRIGNGVIESPTRRRADAPAGPVAAAHSVSGFSLRESVVPNFLALPHYEIRRPLVAVFHVLFAR
jgi:hypothetical protein